MNRFYGLWRDSKWVWIGFIAVDVIFAILSSPLFLALLPWLAGFFIYTAMMRYDENGVDKGDRTS